MRTTVTLRRAVPAAFAAAALLLGGAACGGDKVDKTALTNKIKSDTSFTPRLTDTQASCAADVVIKYIDSSGVNDYIKNGKELPEPKKDKDKATSELQACTKK
ncbi:MAG TPA: hypothetical protein VMU51_22030 [Mycobacteriales bacterium]|nr:hypothetical protein [Mycobacteriales bacterium]